MEQSNQTAISEVDLDDSLEEHIEMESATGRFRRGAIKDAQNRAAAEALANNRRDMRIETGSFIARYAQGDAPKKFSLFGGAKKCIVTDASISGLGIEAAKGLNKGDKVTITVSDGKKGEIPEFEIIATVMYAGVIGNKKSRYGLQYDQSPTMAYTEFLNSETLKHKMKKAAEDENAELAAKKKNAEIATQKKQDELVAQEKNAALAAEKKQALLVAQKKQAELATQEKNAALAAEKKQAELVAQKKRIELAIQKKKMEKTALEREV